MAPRATYDPLDLAAEAMRQRTVVEELAAPLDDAAFARRPDHGGWSVGECLDHLTLMNRVYLDAIDDAMRRGRARGLTREAAKGRRSGRHGWLGDAFARSLEPPPRIRTPTFRRTTPQAPRARADVLADFLSTQDRLTRAIESAGDLDLARVRMRSPFFALLPLSLGQAFGAMLAHNRRHIWQARRVLDRSV